MVSSRLLGFSIKYSCNYCIYPSFRIYRITWLIFIVWSFILFRSNFLFNLLMLNGLYTWSHNQNNDKTVYSSNCGSSFFVKIYNKMSWKVWILCSTLRSFNYYEVVFWNSLIIFQSWIFSTLLESAIWKIYVEWFSKSSRSKRFWEWVLRPAEATDINDSLSDFKYYRVF